MLKQMKKRSNYKFAPINQTSRMKGFFFFFVFIYSCLSGIHTDLGRQVCAADASHQTMNGFHVHHQIASLV